MEVSPQVIEKITKANNILVIVSGNNADSLTAGLALRGFLKKLEKEVIVLSHLKADPKLKFVSGFASVTETIEIIKNFIIEISTKKTQVEELSYKKDPERLSIVIKPKNGSFAAEDISFRNANFPFDLVVVIGVDSLEQLGDIYSRNAELFFEIPIVNIGFRASNENFGQLNVMNLSATSHSEIVFDIINTFDANLIDDTIATLLLTGIIAETDSFQHVRTTPQTFIKASQLVSLGANQQEIITRLYKSKSLGMLKLWGRVLARLSQEPSISLVYSAVNEADMNKSQATQEDAVAIIKEMAGQLGFAKLFLFLKEEAGHTTAYFHTQLSIDLFALFGKFSPNFLDRQTVSFMIPQPVAIAEQEVLDILKSEIGKYSAI